MCTATLNRPHTSIITTKSRLAATSHHTATSDVLFHVMFAGATRTRTRPSSFYLCMLSFLNVYAPIQLQSSVQIRIRTGKTQRACTH